MNIFSANEQKNVNQTIKTKEFFFDMLICTNVQLHQYLQKKNQ